MTTLRDFNLQYTQPSVDAGGRVRVSQLTTWVDTKTLEYDDPYIWSSVVSGTATGTWADNMYDMTVYSNGAQVIRQTMLYAPYLSGKSQVIEPTLDNFAPQADVRKRYGYFSNHGAANEDGFWLQSSGGTITLKIFRYNTEVLSKDITEWTGYKNLAEYKTLSTWDNFTVCFFDFLWLGGAILRLWVKTSKGFVLAHIYHYSGQSQDVVMRYPTQPMRYDITSTGGVGRMRAICSQLSTEGSVDESGRAVAIDNGATSVNCSSVGTTYPILAVRKNANQKHVAFALESVSLFVKSNLDQVRFSVQINPTLSGLLTYSNNATMSGIQQAVGNGTITVTSPGHILMSDYLSYGEPIDNTPLKQNFYAWLGINASDVPQEYVLCVTPITSNVDVLGVLGLKGY